MREENVAVDGATVQKLRDSLNRKTLGVGIHIIDGTSLFHNRKAEYLATPPRP